MINIGFSEGISETLDILNHLDKIYVEKIPKKFMEFLESNKASNYVSNLDHSKKLNEMNLNEQTKSILAAIYMNYWCDTQQKAEYSELLKRNEVKYRRGLKGNYNPSDSYLKNPQMQHTTNIVEKESASNVNMVKYKESVFKKFIKKMTSFLKLK